MTKSLGSLCPQYCSLLQAMGLRVMLPPCSILAREWPCVAYRPPEGHHAERWCRYNTTLFVKSIQHEFFFKTPLPPQVSKTMNLSQHGQCGCHAPHSDVVMGTLSSKYPLKQHTHQSQDNVKR